MRIIFARHAESSNNCIPNDVHAEERVSDPELSEKGIGQAKALGKFLKENEFKIDKCMYKFVYVCLSLFKFVLV